MRHRSPAGISTAQLDAAFNSAARDSVLPLFTHSPTHREEKTKTRRTSLHCGWDYTKLKAGEKIWMDTPPIVTDLYQQVKTCLEDANPGLVLPATFENAIVSRYTRGDRLQPHLDLNRAIAEKKGLKGYFGDQILGVVLQADPRGRLFFEQPQGPLLLNETDGLCFVLQDSFRHDWPHGVTEIADGRLSVTYRTVEFI